MRIPFVALTGAALCIACGWGLARSQERPPLHTAFSVVEGASGDTHATQIATPSPLKTASPQLIVDIEGAIQRPGLLRVRPGARVADAIHAAGGFTADADLSSLNRAEILRDGDQVLVISREESREHQHALPRAHALRRKVSAAHSTSHQRRHAAHRARYKKTRAAKPVPVSIDMNTASSDVIARLPGFSAEIAARIVALREIDGGFRTLDDLLDVNGVRSSHLERLAPYIRFAPLTR